MDSIRQALAIAVLFGGWGFAYLWLGLHGVAGAMLGNAITLCALGIASGYWVGMTPDADKLVTELMKWLKQKRSS